MRVKEFRELAKNCDFELFHYDDNKRIWSERINGTIPAYLMEKKIHHFSVEEKIVSIKVY